MNHKSRNKIYSAIFFAIPVLMISTVIILGFLQKDYNHVRQPISDLAQFGAPYATWMIIFGIAIPGFCMIASAFIINKIIGGSAFKNGSILALISGITYHLLSIARADPKGITETISILHIVFTITSLVSGACGVILAALKLRKMSGWERVGKIALFLAPISLIYTPLMFFLPYPGLSQRVFICLLLFWFLMLGWRLWTKPSSTPL